MAMRAAPGMVKIQAQTTCRATPQRTAESRFTAPTPTIAPVIVCVVLTGIPIGADGSVTTGTLALNTWGQLELHVITTGANTSTVAGS